MISVTDSAKEYLTGMLEKNGKKYAYLSVLGGGCSGFQYDWGMTDDAEAGPLIEDILVVDKTAELFVEKFAEHVNVDAIVDAAREATTSYIESSILANNDGEKTISGTKRSIEEMVVAPTINGQSKYPRLTPKSEPPGFALSREQIEAMASAAGAAGG